MTFDTAQLGAFSTSYNVSHYKSDGRMAIVKLIISWNYFKGSHDTRLMLACSAQTNLVFELKLQIDRGARHVVQVPNTYILYRRI